MQESLVSVIIPTHNRPNLVSRAIGSVLNQTYKNLEVIVVDCGLKERAESIVLGFTDPRITYIKSEKDLNGSEARNIGIGRSGGEYIAFLDDDDEWLSDKLKVQMSLFVCDPEDVGFCFSSVYKNDCGLNIPTRVLEGVLDYKKVSLTNFKGFLTSTLMLRRSVISKIGNFDENLPSHQEAEFILRASQWFKGRGINQPLSRMFSYTTHEHVGGSLDRRAEGRLRVIQRHWKLFISEPKSLGRHYFWLAILERSRGNFARSIIYFNLSFSYSRELRPLFHSLLLRVKRISFKKSILKFYARVKMSGFKYECCFCKKRFKSFYPAGFDSVVLKEKGVISAGYRENVRCPACNSSSRERLMKLFLEKKNVGKLLLGTSILHVAPEKNLEIFLRRIKNLNYLSCDLYSRQAELKINVESIHFPDQTFDLVICSHVLEHVPDDKKAMREILRVLKKGGSAILQVPVATLLETTLEDSSIVTKEERFRVYGQDDHVRLYGKDYVDRLRSVGFIVEVVEPNLFLTPADIAKYSLDPRENIYYCKRSV